MNSLRKKITIGYYAIGFLIVGLALFAFVELRLIEEKVLAGESISKFFDVTLEIRRFEKNFFLYHQGTDVTENETYVATAQRLLGNNFSNFAGLTTAPRIAALQAALTDYKTLMTRYVSSSPSDPQLSALESRIREVGKSIVTVAEELADLERKRLQSSLERHRDSLILSIVALIVLVIAIGRMLSRMVARPLQQMEASMEAVAQGGRDQVDIPSDDREIVSLTNAFNHVLQELDLRQTHLLRAEKLASLGTLLSGVAHELNNPLSNISSSCQILMEELANPDPEYQRELLAQIDEQTGRARNIVRSLLDFAREREFKKESLSLAGLVTETLRFITGQIPANVDIVTDIPADIVIQGDKQRLQQVFLNLINNAIEAQGDAGVITISARRRGLDATDDASGHFNFLAACSTTGAAVEIAIRDTGHGIPAALLPRVFDPFFTTKDVGKGSGLGLSIVYEIIEQHGGCIAAESEPDKGTAFHIRLPLGNAHSESNPKAQV